MIPQHSRIIAGRRAPLAGWTDFHWSDRVLIGTNPRGKRYSMAEAVPTIGKPFRSRSLQTIRRVEVLGPDGTVIAVLDADTMEEAHVLMPALIAHLGGAMRVTSPETTTTIETVHPA